LPQTIRLRWGWVGQGWERIHWAAAFPAVSMRERGSIVSGE